MTGALGVAGALVLSGAGLTAANAQGAGFEVEVYGIDEGEHITDDRELLFDPRKGDEPGNAYQIGYTGVLDMSPTWETYKSLRGSAVPFPISEQTWVRSNFDGTWDMSFTLDPAVLSVDEAALTCDAVNAELDVQNPGTSAGDMLQCSQVGYNSDSGLLTIQLVMQLRDGSRVTGAHLDAASNEPPHVRIPIPPGAVYVAQSAFEAGGNVSLTSPRAQGQMRMDHPLGALVPVTFDQDGPAATLEMVETYQTRYVFESASEGHELPDSVVGLLPEPAFMLRDGVTVQPTLPGELAVAEELGTWEFQGWDPSEGTVNGADVEFTGQWAFLADDDDDEGDEGDEEDTFGVIYRFHAADAVGDGPLPDEVLALLPSSDERFESGTSVEPVQPAQTQVELREEDEAAGIVVVTTWTFNGWDADSVVVADSDVVFTGLWSKTVTEEPIGPPPTETFGVSYEFVPAEGVEGPLPDAVLSLLPTSDERYESGDTVTAASDDLGPVTEVVEDEEANTVTTTTWDFQGWDADSKVVEDSDVVFVGSWDMTVTEEPIGPPPAVTFGVSYEFVPAEGVEGPLPDAVLSQLPTSDERYESGDTVTAASDDLGPVTEVVEDEEANTVTTTTWDFQGWDADSKVVEDSDVVFVGSWGMTVTEEPIGPPPAETFGVSYEFVPAEGVERPLPDALLSLLPTSDERYESGDTVTAADLLFTAVIEIDEDEEANTVTTTIWDFQGWDADSKVVADSDVVFVGTWGMTVTEEPLIEDPDDEEEEEEDDTPKKIDDDDKPDTTLPKSGGAGQGLFMAGGALLLVAGAALTLRQIRRGIRISE
ncbi:hypothetical protein SD72_11030 [Leucobacter komagatae]|uniref:SHIRT domain-containing protein n=2 Tax=Leucobacter komagatae TaxID=55969 RepID=A0A0D0IRV1_9MICO|nr:hypothetical protein SD72_11030 [Leucobacter komagatae]